MIDNKLRLTIDHSSEAFNGHRLEKDTDVAIKAISEENKTSIRELIKAMDDDFGLIGTCHATIFQVRCALPCFLSSGLLGEHEAESFAVLCWQPLKA
mgnify:CR=1 FL=1